MHMLAYCLIGDYWWVSVLRPRLLKIQVRSKAEIKQPFPPLLISKNHKKVNFICTIQRKAVSLHRSWYMGSTYFFSSVISRTWLSETWTLLDIPFKHSLYAHAARRGLLCIHLNGLGSSGPQIIKWIETKVHAFLFTSIIYSLKTHTIMRERFLLSLLVALLTTLSLHAYDFQSGDLYYNITSDNTVEVTYQE